MKLSSEDINELLVVGGKFRPDARGRAEYHSTELGLVMNVHVPSGRVTTSHQYISPRDACAANDTPAILFKSATLMGNRLFVCTQTEVMVYRLPDYEREHYVSLPCFNDVHHVRPTVRDTLLVVSTGLDLVVEVSLQGEILREWNVADVNENEEGIENDTWTKFDRATDYRKVVTTKPHASHPNFVFELKGYTWVTRFIQRDAICLTDPSRRMNIEIESPHDGFVFEDRVYFTTVDGHIVVVNGSNFQTDAIFDLNTIEPRGKSLGWCRGLHVLDDDQIIVGFTRLRPTKVQENLRWLRSRFLGKQVAEHLPARIAKYDLKRQTLDWEVNLEDHGMGVVFSIHPVSMQKKKHDVGEFAKIQLCQHQT